jgi:hypothetical protein
MRTNTAPSVMSAASSHAFTAATGQAISPRGMATRRPGVVFLEPGDIRDGGEGVRFKKPERRR